MKAEGTPSLPVSGKSAFNNFVAVGVDTGIFSGDKLGNSVVLSIIENVDGKTNVSLQFFW